MIEYVSTFIDQCILDDRFTIEEYVDYTATVTNCDIDIFDDMISGWQLKFEWDDDLKWFAIEKGILIKEGIVMLNILGDTTEKKTVSLTDHINSIEFIKLFGSRCKKVGYNVFLIDKITFDFNTMTCNNEYAVNFEFACLL